MKAKPSHAGRTKLRHCEDQIYVATRLLKQGTIGQSWYAVFEFDGGATTERLVQPEARFSIPRRRLWTLISLLFITFIRFYSKFYAGPAADWVNSSLENE